MEEQQQRSGKISKSGVGNVSQSRSQNSRRLLQNYNQLLLLKSANSQIKNTLTGLSKVRILKNFKSDLPLFDKESRTEPQVN